MTEWCLWCGQVVIWFAGLRGAIAFALAQNMPGERADVYTTTTLCICIATTLVCGGLTEPVLERMGMKVPRTPNDLEEPIARGDEVGSNIGSYCNAFHSFPLLLRYQL